LATGDINIEEIIASSPFKYNSNTSLSKSRNVQNLCCTISKLKDTDEAMKRLAQVEESISSTPEAFYDFACAFSVHMFSDKAFFYLEKDLEYRSMQSADAL